MLSFVGHYPQGHLYTAIPRDRDRFEFEGTEIHVDLYAVTIGTPLTKTLISSFRAFPSSVLAPILHCYYFILSVRLLLFLLCVLLLNLTMCSLLCCRFNQQCPWRSARKAS